METVPGSVVPQTASDPLSPAAISEPPVSPMPAPQKSFPWLILAAFILFAAVTGYLFWQNRALQAQLTKAPSPTPAASAVVASADPTAHWLTYTNSRSGYSFRYPAAWVLVDLTGGQQVEVSYQPDKTKPVGSLLVEQLERTPPDLNTYLSAKPIGGVSAQCKVSADKYKTWCYIAEPMLSIFITQDSDPAYNQTLDQILSTFQFNLAGNVDELEVRTFADTYAQAFVDADWPKLKSLLTVPVKAEMTGKESSLSAVGYGLDSYKIKSIQKNANPAGYRVTIEFIRNNLPVYQFPNSQTNPEILVVKENGEWKSITWYLYQ